MEMGGRGRGGGGGGEGRAATADEKSIPSSEPILLEKRGGVEASISTVTVEECTAIPLHRG